MDAGDAQYTIDYRNRQLAPPYAEADRDQVRRTMDYETRLADLGLQLPVLDPPRPNRLRAVRVGNIVYVSGHVAAGRSGVAALRGKVGAEVSVADAAAFARETGLALLSSLRTEIGSLDHVRRVVKVFGMVNCAPGFTMTPAVVDGCSDLLVEVFGTHAGRHARSAIGVAELPEGAPVEIEMIVEIAP
jgi:enamine deaminase RidA (YjgF/YER057c/UK114 family)